jgi:hypothetical protein
MSLDNAIRAIAFSEATTLSGAVALIAKHRNDLDAALRAAAAQDMPVDTEGVATERALSKIKAPPAPGHSLDKLA